MAELPDSKVNKSNDKDMKKTLWYWILVISMSPMAILLLIFMAMGSFLQFLLKASLLFIIVAINTPFAIMSNVSIMVFDYYFRKHSARLWKSGVRFWKSGAWFQESNNDPQWNWSDPRASVGIEIQILVSDFLKTVAAELLVVVSAGIITFFTAPLRVFYISMAISLVAILHKWLNTDCLSKTALSCLCDGYGLNPMMFLYSFIGLFNIGCHPVAKCSFAARRAFLFIKDDSNIEDDGHNQITFETLKNIEARLKGLEARQEKTELSSLGASIEEKLKDLGARQEKSQESSLEVSLEARLHGLEPRREESYESSLMESPILMACCMPYQEYDPDQDNPSDVPEMISRKATGTGTKGGDNQSIFQEEDHHRFNDEAWPVTTDSKANGAARTVTTDVEANGAASPVTTNPEDKLPIHFDKWNAFERGLFQLSPRIDFIKRDNGKYILKSFMVLKLHKQFRCKKFLCEYPVERLELPEDYSKAKELYHFLVTLSEEDAFVSDKMRGRYEHSLTLTQIVDEVEKNDGYKIVKPKDEWFVVA